MARKAEATLWMLVKIGKRSVMKRVVKKGRSYVPRVECPYKPGLTISATRRMATGRGDRWATISRLHARSKRHARKH
jgi:hypothetical protein